MDGKEDVLTVQTYLVDSEVPFLFGKQTCHGTSKLFMVDYKIWYNLDDGLMCF